MRTKWRTDVFSLIWCTVYIKFLINITLLLGQNLLLNLCGLTLLGWTSRSWMILYRSKQLEPACTGQGDVINGNRTEAVRRTVGVQSTVTIPNSQYPILKHWYWFIKTKIYLNKLFYFNVSMVVSIFCSIVHELIFQVDRGNQSENDEI